MEHFSGTVIFHVRKNTSLVTGFCYETESFPILDYLIDFFDEPKIVE